jgi:hypothetical protein
VLDHLQGAAIEAEFQHDRGVAGLHPKGFDGPKDGLQFIGLAGGQVGAQDPRVIEPEE